MPRVLLWHLLSPCFLQLLLLLKCRPCSLVTLNQHRHPDKNNNSEESNEVFKRINAAYARLSKADESDDDLDDIDPDDFFADDLFTELGIDPFFILLSGLFGGRGGRGARGGRGRGGFGMGFMPGPRGMPFAVFGGMPSRGMPFGGYNAGRSGPFNAYAESDDDSWETDDEGDHMDEDERIRR